MIQLHYYPGNASMAPHILLEELGEHFELCLVDRDNGAHKSPEYLKLNPNGTIPVLVDGGLVLYETAAICLHLVDTHPNHPLAPTVRTDGRAHFYKWLVWMTNTLQAALMIFWYPERWTDEPAAARTLSAKAEARIGPMLEQIQAQLASHGGPWLLGEHFSAVDPYALMLCRWTRTFARPARDLPGLGPYLQRVLARPAVQRVYAKEGIAAPWV
jgi:glutathione S-transferase